MGIPAQHEPANTGALHRNVEVFAIFEATGWTVYFQQLNCFHTETTLHFILSLNDTHSIVRGLCIDVTEAIVVEVTSFPQARRSWFG